MIVYSLIAIAIDIVIYEYNMVIAIFIIDTLIALSKIIWVWVGFKMCL